MLHSATKARVRADDQLQATLPWSCTSFGGQSEIEAFIPATGQWATIADVRSVVGTDIDAEELALFIIRAVDAYFKTVNERGNGCVCLSDAVRVNV